MEPAFRFHQASFQSEENVLVEEVIEQDGIQLSSTTEEPEEPLPVEPPQPVEPPLPPEPPAPQPQFVPQQEFVVGSSG